MTVHVRLVERSPGRWQAFLDGKSSPILRPVPGNTRPASAAEWPSEEGAVAELPAMLGTEIQIVARERKTP